MGDTSQHHRAAPALGLWPLYPKMRNRKMRPISAGIFFSPPFCAGENTKLNVWKLNGLEHQDLIKYALSERWEHPHTELRRGCPSHPC